jgi:hypothetical protein
MAYGTRRFRKKAHTKKNHDIITFRKTKKWEKKGKTHQKMKRFPEERHDHISLSRSEES